MKYLFAATLFTSLGTGAFAGALSDPIIEAPVIVEEASSSSSGTVTVAMLAVLLALPLLTD